MIDIIHKHIDHLTHQHHKIYRVRELLQLLALSLLGKKWFYNDCCFVWGTALRICYGLERYSEDLDFFLKQDHQRQDDTWDVLLYEFRLLWLDTQITTTSGTIQSCLLKFPKLLYDLWLTGHQHQKIQIKCEVDINPPSWATRETKIVNDYKLFPLDIYTLPSLMSGKIHAILQRWFVKGRDRFDLVWYLSKKTTPNMTLLRQALQQTWYEPPIHTYQHVIDALIVSLDSITTKQLLDDVGVFLEDDHQRALLDTDLIHNLLITARSSLDHH